MYKWGNRQTGLGKQIANRKIGGGVGDITGPRLPGEIDAESSRSLRRPSPEPVRY